MMRQADLHPSIVQEARKPGSQVGLAMCSGKEPLTWAQAKAILDRTPRKGRLKVAYHCPVCHAWHIGNPVKNKRPWRRW